MPLELELWRVISRYPDLTERVGPLLATLSAHVPASALLVRRFNPRLARLETVAMAQRGGRETPHLLRTELGVAQVARVHQFLAEGVPLIGVAGGPQELPSLLASVAVQGEVLLVPLPDEEAAAGLLVLVAEPGGCFEAAHARLMAEVREPLLSALRLDHLFHELASLREAALADNRALLSRLGRENIVETIVGVDAGLKDVMDRVEQVAPTDAPVLILGETGSGKEVVARAIHARSRRAKGPVVRVNCGAIPPELIDSELFGHERGSFTGAVALRKGWFERADGGTLFLDEIGEMPGAAQVRLLRILQDGSFERVGGSRTLTVDVRVVAATHRDLKEMVGQGSFRADLWYRISVFPIRLPPLREHPQDIPALARYFAAREGRRLGGAPLVPSAADLERLMAYSWPGNVRELGSLIERAVILGDCRRLEIDRAMGALGQGEARVAAGRGVESAGRAPREEVGGLDGAMREHIEAAVARTLGRIEGPHGAAALLGINPHTLRARMRKLGIDWARHRPRRGR